MNTIEYLRKKANELPLCPGVYLMKNKDGKIIYVGKSKKLRNRVSSYFSGKANSYKTAKMVSLVCDFDTILCDSEIEALTLENTLIKKHNISPAQITRLKRNESVSTHTIEMFCKILKCNVEDIMQYIDDEEA